MIKKLRRRFIFIALGVVATVILLIVAGIDVANYVSTVKNADATIDGLTALAFEPSGEEFPSEPPFLPINPNEKPNEKDFERRGLPRETAYSARYFTAETDKDGNVTGSSLEHIAFVQADDLANYVTEAENERGFVGDFRYKKTATETGYKYIFLDCEKEMDACRTFIVLSVIVTVVGLLIIAALIVILSKKTLRPVEESYEKQKRFITDAGHELKTPLTVIGANAELLELDVGENEWIDSIKGQVKKLGKLTKELVFLSRMDEGDVRLSASDFSLNKAVEEVADGFKEAALVAGKKISLTAEDVTVGANEEMVRRAVGLLLDNAIKYAENEEIEVSVRSEGKYAVLEEKNAASLAKGTHAELFERFYRPDTSRSGETGGHGVGLSVVKSIAEAHRGEVSCVSDGNFVTFRMTLPIEKKH